MSCEIYTLSLTGRKRAVCVNSEEEMKNMTLKEFLRRFCPEEEEQLYNCRYIFDGKPLEADQTLGYYGIKNGSTVHTVLLLRGGGPDGGEDEDGDGGEDEDEDEDGDRDRDRDEGEDEDRDGDGDEDGGEDEDEDEDGDGDRDRDEDEDEDEDGDRDEDEDEGMSRTESMDSLDDMQQTEPECCIL